MSKNEWISIEDRLPKEDEEVLVYTEYNNIAVASMERFDIDTKEHWISDAGKIIPTEYHIGKITHWMLLPEPPKEV